MTKPFQLTAVALALLCAGMSTAQAQASRSLTDDRNLSVQRVANPQPRISAQRIALVIGNANYKDAPLTNPVNDARAISKALSDSGFTVILRENADQRVILGALREFGDKLRAGGTGLFYYAGHGMQIKGRNYLIPVGASIEREDEVAYSAVDAQAVLDKMEAAGNGANIMILDACRNNPFTRSTRSGQAGLAQMDAPVGTLVAFATSPGAVASDGAGINGLYTQHLLAAMRKEGSKVEDVFKQVRANVRRDSQGKQVPWEATSLEGDFYFRGGAAGGGQQLDLEQALWDAVKDSKVPIELRAYLNRYPAGRFAEQAKRHIAALQPPIMAAALTPLPVVTANRPTNNIVPNPSQNTQATSNQQPNDLQAAVDQRTEELLKQLAGNHTATVQPSNPAAVQTPRPPASSSFGFTVGDRWRYQVVDKFKGEVVFNYSNQVTSLLNGEILLNGGARRWDEHGNERYSTWSSTQETVLYNNSNVDVPPKFEVGAKTNIAFVRDILHMQGSTRKDQAQGEMIVRARESIKTPAGEFNAWRVERAVFYQSNTGGRWRLAFTGWYVPELRNYVAFEEESRNSDGTFNRRERHELTSYSVRGADEALAKR